MVEEKDGGGGCGDGMLYSYINKFIAIFIRSDDIFFHAGIKRHSFKRKKKK